MLLPLSWVLGDKVSLCGLGWPRTHGNPLAQPSQVRGFTYRHHYTLWGNSFPMQILLNLLYLFHEMSVCGPTAVIPNTSAYRLARQIQVQGEGFQLVLPQGRCYWPGF